VDEAAYSTPDPYLRAVWSRLAPPEMLAEQQGAVTMAMTMPTTEWLCRFSRCVAPGAIASLANSCSLASGWLLVQPAQSFAGLAHSTSFFRAVPADGGLLRAEARGTIRGRGLANVDIDVYNADGQLAASAHAFAQLIDSSKRQKQTASEVKRILATLLFTDIVGSTERPAPG